MRENKFLIILLLLLSFSLADEVTILIPKGVSTAKISHILKEHKIIRSTLWFRIKVKLQKTKPVFYSGLFRLDKKVSTGKIIRELQDKNRLVYVKITIPEGYNIYQIDKLLSSKDLITANAFIEYFSNTENIKHLRDEFPYLTDKDKIKSPEGLLFPDTYFFDFYTPLQKIADTMLDNFKTKMVPVYEEYLNLRKNSRHRYSYREDRVFSFYELLTLASIIENEAKEDEERPVIASVYINRLKRHQALGSCPTVEYARYNLGLPHAENLSFEDLRIPSEYNTYLHAGLPPSPISNPGIKSFKAALYPVSTDYYFFVSLKNGTHHFSKTAREHEQWVNKINREASLPAPKPGQR
ncbi:MAG: endolytic transglycosylase MltG [Candidatus Margulisbacteria bacterium]|nr:endolytic transglycosylase MltG [Candidatus Margulisiibacteriota bacterium]